MMQMRQHRSLRQQIKSLLVRLIRLQGLRRACLHQMSLLRSIPGRVCLFRTRWAFLIEVTCPS